MNVINMFAAKSNLSYVVPAVQSGTEATIVIARDGEPAARLMPLETAPTGKRIRVAKGKLTVTDKIDGYEAAVAAMFAGSAA